MPDSRCYPFFGQALFVKHGERESLTAPIVETASVDIILNKNYGSCRARHEYYRQQNSGEIWEQLDRFKRCSGTSSSDYLFTVGVLQERRTDETVCAGYATTFNAIANAAGVDSLVVLSDAHAWNTTRFDDGNYYFVDVCWNDQDNGFTAEWLGKGSIFVNKNYSDAHVYQAEYTAPWAPELPEDDYKVTADDLGTAVTSIDAPKNFRVTGSGTAGIKVEWDAVSNAEKYHFAAFNGDGVTVNRYTNDTFMYVPYTDNSDKITVWVRSMYTEQDTDIFSDWVKGFTTDKGTETKPDAPTNITAEINDKNSLILSWKNETQKNVLFYYNTDNTLNKMLCAFNCKNTIGFTNWTTEEETYFQIAAIDNDDGMEMFSDPVTFSYSKNGGLKLITNGVTANSTNPAAPQNFTVKIRPAIGAAGRAVECNWDAVSGADGYEFHISAKSDFSHIGGSSIRKPTETSMAYRVSDESEHLYFRVRTIKGSGDNAIYSEWITTDIITPAAAADAPEKPEAPKNVMTASKDDGESFTWDEVQAVSGYTLTLFKDADHTEVWVEYNTTELKEYLAPFTSGKTYYGGIRAVVSKDGNDVYSDYTYFSFIHQ